MPEASTLYTLFSGITGYGGLMQSLCIRSAVEEVVHLEHVYRDLPPLAGVFEAWHSSGSRGSMSSLQMREQYLGAATLSSESVCLLYDIASQFLDDVHGRVCTHEASQSALETQALLPQQVLVLKTVSMDLARTLLLWSCVGEQEITRGQQRHVATALDLPLRAAKRCSINAPDCNPEQEFAMMRGMVSPFLPPHHPHRLAAVVLVSWPPEWEDQGLQVGISLSLFESLIIPLTFFRPILYQYMRRAYTPPVRWIELPSEEWQAA
ncbi:MAG: hypothetical protein NVSMB27_46980 [Ktedonobacteraceae bacterium]